MDLVDLDRVLDEFEAREEQHEEPSTVRKKDVVLNKEERIENAERKDNLSTASDRNPGLILNNVTENSAVNSESLVEFREDGFTGGRPIRTDGVGGEPVVASFESETPIVCTGESVHSQKPVPPPDVTSDMPSNIDQEPEDPKSSPKESSELLVENVADKLRPPPDVVAGHKIVRSRSSTPSPVAVAKRPVGFFPADDEEESSQHVSEQELETYLNELEEKLGHGTVRNYQDENNQRTPSSDDLKSYLANLEKISGEALVIGAYKFDESNIPENVTIESRRSYEPASVNNQDDSVSEEIPEASVGNSSKNCVDVDQADPTQSRPVAADDVFTEKQDSCEDKSRINLDEDDVDEDPYVLLAFSGRPDSNNEGASVVCPVNLKTEIEQALLNSDQASGHPITSESVTGIQGDDNVTPELASGIQHDSPAVDSTSDTVSPESSADAEKQDNHSGDESAGKDAIESENVQENKQQEENSCSSDGPSGESESAGLEESGDQTNDAQATEPSISGGGSTSVKRQLVTICRLENSPTDDQDTTGGSGSGTIKLTESELQLGRVQPIWIPDADSIVCMLCESKFTLIRRRHHCRACGRVLCNVCCNQRAILPYMASASLESAGSEGKKRQSQEARVCNSCFDRLKRIEEYEKQVPDQTRSTDAQQATPPVTEGNTEAGSTSGTTSTTVGASVSSTSSPRTRPPVLKREGSRVRQHGEPKQVIFSDGIKPGGDLTETPPRTVTTPSAAVPATSSTSSVLKTPVSAALSRRSSASAKGVRARELECLFVIPCSVEASGQSQSASKWPPVLSETDELCYLNEETIANSFADLDEKDEDQRKTVTFVLKRNLRVRVRLTRIDCCLQRLVWCFASDGLRNVSQDEILIVIERGSVGDPQEPEKMPPVEVFVHINILYEEALKGKPLGDLSYSVFSQIGMVPEDVAKGYFGSKDNAGFLYFRPTFQCFENLCLPESPFLIGMLIQKSEVSWAKVMPLRLLLRLGVEYRYYPYPLLSDRFRKALFYETGHTIMNLLADMRNFTYSLPTIPGSTVALEDTETVILIPADQYNQVLKILQSSNEHVLAWAASLHKSADAYLVCVQQSDTLSYTSQTINRENRQRKLTGACFVVFNASLKAGGAASRVSIVEDGIMVQIRPEAMERLRQSLHQQQPFELLPQSCSAEGAANVDASTNVKIQWIPSAAKLNRFVLKSNIDGHVLTDAARYRLHGKTVESSNRRKLIRLIELYLWKEGDDKDNSSHGEPEDLQSMVRQVATAFASALVSFLDLLTDANMRTVAVRFAMGTDLVEYSAGSNGQALEDPIMSAVDDILIPLLHSSAMGAGNNDGGSLLWRVELVMRLLEL